MKVYKREEIYSGKYFSETPDLICLLNFKYDASGLHIKSNNIFESPVHISGYHDMNGIFAVYGKNIKNGIKVNGKIIDLTPTILHIMNVPIPNDMDGKVLMEIFKEDLELAKREIKYQDVYEKIRIKDKIKN